MPKRNPEFTEKGKKVALKSVYDLTKENPDKPDVYWGVEAIAWNSYLDPPVPVCINGTHSYVELQNILFMSFCKNLHKMVLFKVVYSMAIVKVIGQTYLGKMK